MADNNPRRRVLVPAAPVRCPVCGRTDARLRTSGKLFNHGVPGDGPDAAMNLVSSRAGFGLCLGSGKMLVELQQEAQRGVETIKPAAH